VSPCPRPHPTDRAGWRAACDYPHIGDTDHDFIIPSNDMEVRRLMVGVVHRDLDAVEDGERRHGWEAYDAPGGVHQIVDIRARTSTLVP
jgi:hypothetical protein